MGYKEKTSHYEMPTSEMVATKLKRVHLLPLSNNETARSLRDNLTFDRTRPILAIDFPVNFGRSGAEVLTDSGLLCGFEDSKLGVACIDHHADDHRMWRSISTTPLMCFLVREYGLPIEYGYQPAINHMDADIVLATLVAIGIIDPRDERFASAAVAADHTGEQNDIGDLLNGIEHKRDLVFSWQALQAHLQGERLPEEAIIGWEKRKADRNQALQAVNNGEFMEMAPGVFVYQSQGSLMRTEYVCNALPDAKVIVTATKSQFGQGYDYKIRVGPSWPEGHSLHQLNLPLFGGRWNAGGTIRAGQAVTMSPDIYASEISRKMSTLRV